MSLISAQRGMVNSLAEVGPTQSRPLEITSLADVSIITTQSKTQTNYAAFPCLDNAQVLNFCNIDSQMTLHKHSSGLLHGNNYAEIKLSLGGVPYLGAMLDSSFNLYVISTQSC